LILNLQQIRDTAVLLVNAGFKRFPKQENKFFGITGTNKCTLSVTLYDYRLYHYIGQESIDSSSKQILRFRYLRTFFIATLLSRSDEK
jgi:hypothetical protein